MGLHDLGGLIRLVVSQGHLAFRLFLSLLHLWVAVVSPQANGERNTKKHARPPTL